MTRREAREIAFRLLFEIEFQKEQVEEQIAIFFEENECRSKDKAYIEDVVRGTINNLDTLDKSIEKYLKGWKINRISKTDLSVLRLAMYEILNRDDIPNNVSINEAVDIAKKFGDADAGAFVNGVLAQFIKEMPAK
jgi:N utilization substance protein B